MSEKKKEFLRTVKFVLFSISAGVIQVVSFTLMEEVFHITHWISYLVALVLSVLWNFTLNRKFTFCSANNVPVAMLKVAGFYLIFTPVSTWWTAVLTGPVVAWNEYLVLAVTMLVNFVTEYLYDRFVVFAGSIDTAKKGGKIMKYGMKISENLYRLTIPYKDIFTTVCVIRTPKGDMVFDTASFDSDFEEYTLPFLNEVGVTQESLKYIFISHDHPDHSGGLTELIKAFPNACVLSCEPSLKEEYAQYNVVKPEDGDVFLDVLQVVTIPGHSMDSAGVLDTRDNTLVSGDSLQLYGIFGSQPWGAAIYFMSAHFEAVAKLRTMEIDNILTAHDYHPYGYLHQGKEAVAKVLDACVEPLLRLKKLSAENPELDNKQLAALYNTDTTVPPVNNRVTKYMRNEEKQ